MVWKEKIAASLDYETRDFKDQREETERGKGWERNGGLTEPRRRRREGSEKPLSLPSKSQFKEQPNGRSPQRLQAIWGIYEAPRGTDQWSAKGQREKCSACVVRLCYIRWERVTHHGGSSAMRLWLTSRTSSFFASHSQSGKDSIWFLQEESGWTWWLIMGCFFSCKVTYMTQFLMYWWAELDMNSICYKKNPIQGGILWLKIPICFVRYI